MAREHATARLAASVSQRWQRMFLTNLYVSPHLVRLENERAFAVQPPPQAVIVAVLFHAALERLIQSVDSGPGEAILCLHVTVSRSDGRQGIATRHTGCRLIDVFAPQLQAVRHSGSSAARCRRWSHARVPERRREVSVAQYSNLSAQCCPLVDGTLTDGHVGGSPSERRSHGCFPLLGIHCDSFLRHEHRQMNEFLGICNKLEVVARGVRFGFRCLRSTWVMIKSGKSAALSK